jgi:hypothetical protein
MSQIVASLALPENKRGATLMSFHFTSVTTAKADIRRAVVRC